MGQQVSIIELKEQIEAAKRSLAEMSPVDIAADPLFQPAAMPTANSAGLAGGHEDDAPDAFNQNLPANDDMAIADMAIADMATADMATGEMATGEMATGEMATGEMATGEDFQFFHRPKRSDRPFAPSSPMSMANADVSARGGDQLLFQAFDQRLDRLEDDIGQNRKHIHELITLLSDLDMAAQPALRNSASAKYLLRRNLYWFVIGLLVISWGALTPSGHYWINYFLGLI
jgi:hypothetical protein